MIKPNTDKKNIDLNSLATTLIPIHDVHLPWLVTPADKARFEGGFFTQKLSTGKSNGLYAKTRTGIIYVRNNVDVELEADGQQPWFGIIHVRSNDKLRGGRWIRVA